MKVWQEIVLVLLAIAAFVGGVTWGTQEDARNRTEKFSLCLEKTEDAKWCFEQYNR